MKGSPAGEKREEPHAQEPEQVIETSGHPDLPHHRRHTSAGGSGPREGSQYAYRHRNSSGVIGSDAPLLDRRLSSIAPRRSGSFASIQELTGIEFNPPPTDADDNYWFACKWLPSRHTCKSIAPAEVKEVDRRWQRMAFLLYMLLLFCFFGYIVKVVFDLLRARSHPPTRVTETTGIWPLPNVVVCQEHIVELSYALQSGFSEGYLLPDRTLPNYKSMAQLLDPQCKPVQDQSCIWVEFATLVPINGSTATSQSQPQMIMDFLFFPKRTDDWKLLDLPLHKAAFLTFTDMSQEQWCSSDEHLAYQNRYAIPVSTIQDDTSRTYNLVSLVRRRRLRSSNDGVRSKYLDESFYMLKTQSVPVTNAVSMVEHFTWFVPCGWRRTPKGDCQDELDARVAYAKAHQTTADALLMTFIQEALITTYTEVDPWSWLDVLGAIGGFWSYVLAIFTLIFVTNERGKRKPHWILRRQTWVRFSRNTQRLAHRTWRQVTGIFLPGSERSRGLSRGSSSSNGGANSPIDMEGGDTIEANEGEEEDDLDDLAVRLVKMEKLVEQLIKTPLPLLMDQFDMLGLSELEEGGEGEKDEGEGKGDVDVGTPQTDVSVAGASQPDVAPRSPSSPPDKVDNVIEPSIISREASKGEGKTS